MSTPMVIELWCGPTGMAAHYQAEGFRVLGLDPIFQATYPGAFMQADILNSPIAEIIEVNKPALVVAHPPTHLVDQVRDMLQAIEVRLGIPFVIDTVESAVAA